MVRHIHHIPILSLWLRTHLLHFQWYLPTSKHTCVLCWCSQKIHPYFIWDVLESYWPTSFLSAICHVWYLTELVMKNVSAATFAVVRYGNHLQFFAMMFSQMLDPCATSGWSPKQVHWRARRRVSKGTRPDLCPGSKYQAWTGQQSVSSAKCID